MRKAYMVYNPKAGRLPPEKFVERAAEALRKQAWEVDIFATRDGAHLSALALQAAESGQEALFLAGGDGSIGRTLKGLSYSETALATLPAGTANVWAKEIQLPILMPSQPQALTKSALSQAAGTRRRIDVGHWGNHYFLLWVGIGLDAMVVRQMESGRSRLQRYIAPLQYSASIIQTINHWRGMDLEIVVDDAHISGRFMIALITNIPKYAGGYLKLATTTVLDDGEMDLWLFKGDRMRDVLGHIWSILRGKQFDSPHLERIPFRKLTIKSDQPLTMHADGDPLPSAHEMSIEVLHRALPILVPPETPQDLFSSHTRDKI